MHQLSRFDLAAAAIRRVPRLRDRAAALGAGWGARIDAATTHAHEHLEDEPGVRDRTGTDQL